MSEPGKSAGEVRDFARIEDRFDIELWPVEEDDLLAAAPRILAERSLHGEAAAPAKDPEHAAMLELLRRLLTRVEMVEQKLDGVAAGVTSLRHGGAAEEDHGRVAAQAFDISGSGVGLLSPAAFATGQHLRLVLHLPGPTPARLRAMGQVATLLPPDGKERPVGRYRLGVAFTAINEDDRQALVRYIFQRQRALLRSSQRDGEAGTAPDAGENKAGKAPAAR